MEKTPSLRNHTKRTMADHIAGFGGEDLFCAWHLGLVLHVLVGCAWTEGFVLTTSSKKLGCCRRPLSGSGLHAV